MATDDDFSTYIKANQSIISPRLDEFLNRFASKTFKPITTIGTDIQSNKDTAIEDTEPITGLTDRQSLSPDLITTALNAMNIKYECNEDGDYQLYLPNDTVTIGISLPAPSEIRIACVYNDRIPDTKWMKALLALNEFHKTSKFGHAYLLPISEKEAKFIYELWLDFEDGMVSEEYLIRRTIVRAIENAGELFTKIAQECEL